MYKRLKEPFGKAGLIVALIALVFALTGGALAATGNNPLASSSKAKQGKRGKPGKPGKEGKQGPQGLPGTNGTNGTNGEKGAKGDKGEKGDKGDPGDPGKSVTLTDYTGTECAAQTASEEGLEVKVEGAPSAKYVCDGEEGEKGEKGDEGNPWTDGGTLPHNATETGAWSLSTTLAGTPEVNFGPGFEWRPQIVSMPFPIPLASAPQAVFVPEGNTTTAHCSAAAPNGPGGTPGNPKADSGFVCIYVESALGSLALSPFVGFGPGLEAGKTGARAGFEITGDTIATGSWAVTG